MSKQLLAELKFPYGLYKLVENLNHLLVISTVGIPENLDHGSMLPLDRWPPRKRAMDLEVGIARFLKSLNQLKMMKLPKLTKNSSTQTGNFPKF